MTLAKRNNFGNISCGKFFIMGSKTLPWGIPLMTDVQSDNAEVTHTCCL